MPILHDLRRPLRPKRDDFLDIETTAQILQVPDSRVREMIMRGIVAGCGIPDINGGDWIVTAKSVLSFLNDQKGTRPGRRLEYLPAIGRQPWGRYGLSRASKPDHHSSSLSIASGT
jgi:hypothetical protein